MTDLCEKLRNCTERNSQRDPTHWSDISAASQLGAPAKLMVPGLDSNKLFSGKTLESTAFFGPQPQIGAALTDWAKHAAVAFADYVKNHPDKVVAGLAGALLLHRLGEGPILSAAFGSAITANVTKPESQLGNLGRLVSPPRFSDFQLKPAALAPSATTVDWNSLKPKSTVSHLF
jgi:hypothetical protein